MLAVILKAYWKTSMNYEQLSIIAVLKIKLTVKKINNGPNTVSKVKRMRIIHRQLGHALDYEYV